MTTETRAASNAPATTRTPAQAAYARNLVLQEIELRWGKFDREELSNLKDNADLVMQLVVKYGLDRAAAQRDVDTVLQGRAL